MRKRTYQNAEKVRQRYRKVKAETKAEMKKSDLCSTVTLTSAYLAQDAQKGRWSHPPNPGAPRRAVPRARPQRAKRRGVRFGTLSL